MQAYERFWCDPTNDAAWLVFTHRHAWVRERFDSERIWALYRARLRRAGIDPRVIIESGGIVFRRV